MFYEEHLGKYWDEDGNILRGMSWYELNKERIDRQRTEAAVKRSNNRNKRKRKRK